MTIAPEWRRAKVALQLLCIDPGGLGGLWLRARAGDVRARFLDGLVALPWPLRKLPPSVGDEALYGGLDLAATLAAGAMQRSEGILQPRRAMLLPMAESCPAGLAVRLGHWLDAGEAAVIACDEGEGSDSLPPASLSDRLGLFINLDGLGWSKTETLALDTDALASARARLPSVRISPEAIEALTLAAAAGGIASLRAPIFALAAARANAALRGSLVVEDSDLRLAAELTLAHRATPAPEAQSEPEQPEPPPPQEGENETREGEDMRLPDEILLEAMRASLPADLLDKLIAGRAARAMAGSGAGAKRRGNRRGRPLPSRPNGGTQARIDPVATLRAAAPWQAIRRAAQPDKAGLLIRASDFRFRQYQESSDRVVIFAVDASGSAALARLAEAKGAVELLLAQAYSRRDHVALIAFRGKAAEVLLPPTRSLVQTKRKLAGLPGGGGTPLAAGLQLALELALQARGRGMTPTVALLTDGRANVALDGRGDRALAMSEARAMAAQLAARGIKALVIDTASRPQPELRALANCLRAGYLPLPRADAARMSAALTTALGG